jgi:hypothetical protein
MELQVTKRFVLPMVLVLAGCGDISDGALANAVQRQDLEFAMALPSAQDVAVDTPDDGSATQGLEADVHGLTRAICQGKPQQGEDIFCNGHLQAVAVNTLTRGVLALVDFVRSLPPTARERDARTWGPYPDTAHPGRSWQAHVRREPASGCVDRVLVDDGVEGGASQPDGAYVYRWNIEVTPPGGATVRVLSGCYRPGRDGTASGVGRLTWEAKLSRDGLQDEGAKDLNRLTIDYDLLSPQRRILATFVGVQPDGSDGAEIRFGSRRGDDGGGWGYSLRVDFNQDQIPDQLDVRARWLRHRAGRADARLTLGNPPHLEFFVRECWNEQQDRTYFELPWFGSCPEGTVRDGGQCIAGEPSCSGLADLFH